LSSTLPTLSTSLPAPPEKRSVRNPMIVDS
jgi:hypothetical protein